MKNTGLLLREKRESSNLSISEVALATKINPKILAAIENGDTENLPAKTFLKGFIRSYAVFLKLDVDEVLRIYLEESGGPPPAQTHEAYAKPSTEGGASSPLPRRRVEHENSSGMRTAAIVVIVILIGLIIGVRELIEKYQREKIVESAQNIKLIPLAQPPAPEVPQAALDNTNAPAAPAPEIKPVESTPAEQKTAEQKSAEEEKLAIEQKKAAELKKIADDKKIIEDKKSAEKVAAEQNKIEPKTAAVKTVRREIILEALDKVDIKFELKGEVKRVSLGPTEVHTIHTDQPVVFDFSDGGAVSIILNGHDRGVPGDLGKPKQVTIP